MNDIDIAAELEQIAKEQDEVLSKFPAEMRYRMARELFAETIFAFSRRHGHNSVIANPEYAPTITMRKRAAREAREALEHRRALEIARAGAPITNIHYEVPVKKGWFW